MFTAKEIDLWYSLDKKMGASQSLSGLGGAEIISEIIRNGAPET
jgi:hypothetical protein